MCHHHENTEIIGAGGGTNEHERERSWNNLAAMIWICALMKFVPLAMLPLIRALDGNQKEEKEKEKEEEEKEEEEENGGADDRSVQLTDVSVVPSVDDDDDDEVHLLSSSHTVFAGGV